MSEPSIAEAMNSPKAKIFRTTPIGVAVYPHLIAHDEYQLTQNSVYQCNTKLLLDPAVPKVKEFVDDIDSMVSETFKLSKAKLTKDLKTATGNEKGKMKKALDGLVSYTPYDDQIDDDGEPTGKLLFKMKSTVSGIDKKTQERWNREIAIFDSQNEKIMGPARSNLKLWGGSKIAIAMQVVPYCALGLKHAGVSLRITAVQVVELAGAERTADAYGFGTHNEGFHAGDDTATTDDEESVDASTAELEEEEF